MSNVINLTDRRPKPVEESSTMLCVLCGSGWWIVAAVCIGTDGRISGWSGVPQCRDCGHFQVRVGI